MKKILVIAVLFLSTGLTALSISHVEKKAEAPLKKTTVAEKADAISSNANLATAD